MLVEISAATGDLRVAVKNLFLLYRYDLMPFVDGMAGASLNRFATIADGDLASHDESVCDLDVWWTKPAVLFPMLVRVGGSPVGLAMVSKPPHAHQSVDFRMEDFFIANRWRRSGVGRLAVAQIFARHGGIWEMGWLPRNTMAEQFWRRVMPTFAESIEEWQVEQAPGQPALPGLRSAIRPQV